MLFNILKIVLVSATFCVLACERHQELAGTEPNVDDIPDQESWNATLTTTKEGVATSKISYSYMQRFRKRRVSKFLEGVEIELYNSAGSQTSRVVSQEAEFHESERKLEMTGNVIARSNDGFTLRTENLTWEDFNETITSDDVVQVVTAEGDTINGVGFESDKFFDNWTIKKPWGTTQKRLNLEVVNSDEGPESEN